MAAPALALSLLLSQPADPVASPDASAPEGREVEGPTAVAAPEVDETSVEPSTPAPVVTTSREPTKTSPTIERAEPPAAEAPKGPYKIWKDPVPLQMGNFVPGKGFHLGTKDERFTMRIHGRVQVRYDIDHPGNGGNTHQTLQIRRARVVFGGNVFSKYVHYYIQLGFSPRDQLAGIPNDNGTIRRTPLRDARLEFDRPRDFTLWAGQMKVPFSRQRVVSSSSLNLVDRSIANDEFQLDRDVGLQVLSKDVGGLGWLGYNAGVFLGEGRNVYDQSDFGMLYVARVEMTPLGKFEDYSEGDLDRNEKPKLAIGGAYAFQNKSHYTNGTWGDPPADRGTSDVHNATADVILKWKGLSVQSAFHWRQSTNRRNGGAVDAETMMPIATALPRDGVGWFAQVGWLVPKIPLEIVGRYGFVRNIRGADRSAIVWRDEVGGGLNYYIYGHWLKLQLDYFRLYGADQGPSYASAARHGNDRMRLQLQVSF